MFHKLKSLESHIFCLPKKGEKYHIWTMVFISKKPWDERYIYLDDWLIFMVMYVGKYSIHGCYGYVINLTLDHVTNAAIILTGDHGPILKMLWSRTIYIKLQTRYFSPVVPGQEILL